MELPTSVPWPPPQLHGPAEKNCPLHYIATSFSDVPSYDDEGSDGDWKPWAAQIVKERSVRVHSCFGLVVYLQRSPEWAKTSFSRREQYRAHRLLYPLPGPERINTGGIEAFTRTKWEDPTPKPAGWRPHVPAFWDKRDDVSHHDYWTRAGKRQPHIQTPWHSEPVPMPWNNPDPEEIAKWELWNGGVAPTFLTTYLKRLLFMNDFIVTDPHPHPKRTRMMFPMYDTDDKVVEV